MKNHLLRLSPIMTCIAINLSPSNAATLNSTRLDQYASAEQVTSISQFSNVQPTD